MLGFTLLSFSVLSLSTLVRADYFSSDPLVNKVVPYDAIPYQVMTDTDDPRGFQSGYNQCNQTTENQNSECQTMFVNHIDDFCFWAPPEANQSIADAEGIVVAWCTKKGHGTRIIPDGTFLGVTVLKTPSYLLISANINQNYVNVGGLYGGELDSGGQDGEGNPMGGLVYSNAFPSNNGNNASYQQVQHWSFFIGSNAVCGKVCDQTGSNPHGLCNNIYDRLGCAYNAPAVVENGTFQFCLGDDMEPVGTYVVDGVTSVYTQPAETDPIGVVPYTATPAPTSSCTTYASSAIFTDGVGVTVAAGNGVENTAVGSSGPSATGSAGSGGSGGAKTTGSTKVTGSNGAPSPSGSSGAISIGVSVGAMAIAFFAVLAQN